MNAERNARIEAVLLDVLRRLDVVSDRLAAAKHQAAELEMIHATSAVAKLNKSLEATS